MLTFSNLLSTLKLKDNSYNGVVNFMISLFDIGILGLCIENYVNSPKNNDLELSSFSEINMNNKKLTRFTIFSTCLVYYIISNLRMFTTVNFLKTKKGYSFIIKIYFIHYGSQR
jgi:hypothetical protein